MLKELKRSCKITYITLDDGTADSEARELASEYCHELVCIPHRRRQKFTTGFYVDLMLNVASQLPYAIKKYESQQMREEISGRLARNPFQILVCDFLAPAVNVPSPLNCPSILFQHNVEAMIWKRHYEVQTSSAKKAYLLRQWQKMRSFEAQACSLFDCVVAVSREDRELMRREYGVRCVYDVPTGVDTSFFRPNGHAAHRPGNLVFTGSMDWLPNEDAIRFFTQDIMPRIKAQVPNVTLTVVGRDPYPALVEMARRDPAIEVTGRVDDVRPFIERAAVYIVPLRIGGGTRLKIFEAMAMEKAIVSTSIGAEGLPVADGKDILLADDPAAFAEAVVKLIQQQEFANEVGKRAATKVREHFGWNKVAESFASVCEHTVAHRQPGSSRVIV